MSAQNWRIKLSLFLNYFAFAILLNSVGTVILQVQNNYGVPTFNSKELKLPTTLSIEMASILAASTALGRFLAGAMLLWRHSFFRLLVCFWHPFTQPSTVRC